MNVRMSAAALALALLSTPARAADLKARELPAPTVQVRPEPAPVALSSTVKGTVAGVIIGAGLMLLGTTRTDKPQAARNLTQAGLAVMIVLPLAGMSGDMMASSTWEAVPSR